MRRWVYACVQHCDAPPMLSTPRRSAHGVDFGWGNPTDNKPNINLLTSDAVWDPVSGGYPNRLFLCEARPMR